MIKTSRQKFKCLENEKTFEMKHKTFYKIFTQSFECYRQLIVTMNTESDGLL